MDVHQVITTAVEEVLHGVAEANKALAGKAKVGEPSSVEIEVGITSSYEVANYDDVRVATVRVKVPIFHGKTEAPASAALEAEADPAAKKDGDKGGSKKQKK
jgi:hypothetical protein